MHGSTEPTSLYLRSLCALYKSNREHLPQSLELNKIKNRLFEPKKAKDVAKCKHFGQMESSTPFFAKFRQRVFDDRERFSTFLTNCPKSCIAPRDKTGSERNILWIQLVFGKIGRYFVLQTKTRIGNELSESGRAIQVTLG